jgi:hypothetical protein
VKAACHRGFLHRPAQIGARRPQLCRGHRHQLIAPLLVPLPSSCHKR